MSASKKPFLLKTYADLTKEYGRYPSRAELAAKGVNRDCVRKHFANYEVYREASRKVYPKSFKDVIDESRFNDEVHSELESFVRTHKRFVVTTAVAGCPVSQKAYKSLKNYCKRKNALLLILPADNALQNLDKELVKNEHIVFGNLPLNENIHICPIKLSPKQIDPLTGLKRFTQKESSLILASPKQRMLPVSTSNVKIPRVLMTTGAITEPRYHNRKLVNKRIDFMATWDHVIGAVIVEIEDNHRYYFRQVQADPKKGYITDLGVEYHADGSIKKVEADLAIGDWHSGETDPTARKAWREVSSLIDIRYKIMHDFHNGLSINHHEEENTILRSMRAQAGELSLEAELRVNAKDLDELLEDCEKLVMTKSNHDEFLDRWIREGRYVKDPHNYHVGVKLAQAMLEGKDPLKAGVELYGFSRTNRVVWLNRDQDFYIAGFQAGSHGDCGPNGSRGSIRSMEEAYGKTVFGHRHYPEVLRGAIGLGTSSRLKLSYNRGPSSWIHSSCLIYPNGSFQLINSIEGKWRLED